MVRKRAPLVALQLVAAVEAKRQKVARVAEAEMMMGKEKKIKLSVCLMLQQWKMPTIFVTRCPIFCIFADFFGKVLEEREKGREREGRRKGKKDNLTKDI